jgi:5-formyltetrahydrofolate cyclo-ligase
MTDMLDPSTAKIALRPLARAVRDGAFCADAGDRLATLAGLLPLTGGACVAGYWPLAGEIDPLPLLRRLAGLGHPLALPEVTARDAPLRFRLWRHGDDLVPGPHGTRHPPADAPPCRPDLILVPLLAFDGGLYRLGYGGGYYDRTLDCLRRTSHIQAIGLAYAVQRVARLPRDDYDQRLDGVLTETGLILPEE